MKNFKFDKIFIVAEAGVNHEGKYQDAIKLVKAAKKSGADAIKFQSYNLNDYIWNQDTERFQRMTKFSLNKLQFKKIFDYAKKIGILCFTTPLDNKSVKFFSKISPFFKVASGDINNFNLIDAMLKYNLPIIFSTGLSSEKEILKTYKYILKRKPKIILENKLAVMHCKSAYPCPDEEADLKNITLLKEKLNCIVGYSDHTLGTTACETSASFGAKIIEKHFTLSKKNRVFRDHNLSATPTELKKMIKKIRLIEKLIGNKKREITNNELANLKYLRRSLFLNKNIKKGTTLKLSDFKMLRPMIGEKIEDLNLFVNKKTKVDLIKNQPFFKKTII